MKTRSLIWCMSLALLMTWRPLGRQVATSPAPSPALEIYANKPVAHQAITFVLGEDGTPDNPYFAHAARYYKQHAQTGDAVVTHLRSLVEVQDYLCQQSPAIGQAWKTIRLIVHSNPWMGISVPVVGTEKRANSQTIMRAIQQQQLSPLPKDIVDDYTQLQVLGCGLGDNKALMSALGVAFGISQVVSPQHFVQYRQNEWGEMQQLLNRVYYAIYPTGYHPGDRMLAQELATVYTESDVNWNEALRTATGAAADLTYYYEFKVPVTWIVTYGSNAERPGVKTQLQKETWLKQQPELQAKLQQLQLEEQNFTWTIYPMQYTFADGVTEPAIKAIGLCNVVCVLEPIGATDAGHGSAFLPLQPSVMDGEHFRCIDLQENQASGRPKCCS